MKLCIYADNHFSQYSSILRSRGEKYSKRLENQIQSINWVEKLAEKEKCNYIICLGDFFDKQSLNAEEITALKEIEWCSSIHHIFLVGNHESQTNDLSFNTSNLFNLLPHSEVISVPSKIEYIDFEICFLPYETETKPLNDIFGQYKKKRLVLSHNNLCGIEYGGYISKDGLNLADIDANCDLFLNGHLHNLSWVSRKILNVGNLTGQNFSEDATIYQHNAIILDISELSDRTICLYEEENPYAFNFYKINYGDKVKFKPNAVVMCKCTTENADEARKLFLNDSNIVEYKIFGVYQEKKEDISDKKVENIPSFYEFIGEYYKENLKADEILFEECVKLK